MMGQQAVRDGWRGLLGWAAGAWILFTTLQAQAEHFAITLKVESAQGKAEAFADEEPPVGGLNPRPVFHTLAGQRLTWQFFLTNVKPHAPFRRLKVHYALIEQDNSRTGQTTAALSSKNPEPPVFEGEFLLDLKYHGRVGIRQQFQIDHPGLYLLRVESENSGSDHEHFSAINIQVD
jgi:hypothetical protein